MSARAISSTTISFGLVSLPVKLYATSESGHRIRFNLVHEACGTRVKQQYVCPKCEVVVPRDDMVKGYELSKGQYVLFDKEELDKIQAPGTDGSEITGFVPADEVRQTMLEMIEARVEGEEGRKPAERPSRPQRSSVASSTRSDRDGGLYPVVRSTATPSPLSGSKARSAL